MGGAEGSVDWVFLDEFRAFGINADQWTTAVQDDGEWRRTAGPRAERFRVKWKAAEKSRAGHTSGGNLYTPGA